MGSDQSSGESGRRTPLGGLPLMVGEVIVHSDILTECFCCDISACQGLCCKEGDAGAPVTPDEIARIEDCLDALWHRLSAAAQAEIDRRGVAYPDPEGELVTSIIRGGDCVFRGQDGCLLSPRPVSCHLYPIRERRIGSYVTLSYHRWDICQAARTLGKRRGIHVYQFLREPLTRRFGKDWYSELELTAKQMQEHGII